MSNRKILLRSVVASADLNEEETLLFAKNAGKGTSLGGGDVDVTVPA